MQTVHISGLARQRRRRRLLSTVGIVVPVAAFVAAAGVFIRTHIAPPSVSIPERIAVASLDGAPVPLGREPETTGIAVRTADPPLPMAAALAFAPPLALSMAAASDPAAVTVPLPPPRPRIANGQVNGRVNGQVNGAVPLPRPRPSM